MENASRRGRPRKENGEVYKWDIRITPCDGQPIDWNLNEFNPIKLLVGEEIGKQNGKLHYHAYLETRLSDTCLRQQIMKLARWTPHHPSGNAVFKKSIAHDGTEGYAVKEGKVVYRDGYDDTELYAILNRSQQYRRDIESSKKSKSRAAQKTMKEFIEEVTQYYKSNPDLKPSKIDIANELLNKYHVNEMMFPSRGPIENATMTILSRLGIWDSVLNYYTKNM